MQTNRFLLFAAPIIIAAMVGCYLFVDLKSRAGHLEPRKITAAIQAYSREMKAQNQSFRPTVSLQELVTKGYLKHGEVSAFDGWIVTVSLTEDESNPQSV